jgi:hypothetical protein
MNKNILIIFLFLVCEGCSLIGLGIGSAVPKYEEPPAAGKPAKRVGSYWAEGLITGAILDACAITVIVIAAANSVPDNIMGNGRWE